MFYAALKHRYESSLDRVTAAHVNTHSTLLTLQKSAVSIIHSGFKVTLFLQSGLIKFSVRASTLFLFFIFIFSLVRSRITAGNLILGIDVHGPHLKMTLCLSVLTQSKWLNWLFFWILESVLKHDTDKNLPPLPLYCWSSIIVFGFYPFFLHSLVNSLLQFTAVFRKGVKQYKSL